LRSRWAVGKRFELCRLIADGLIAPEGEFLLPATTAKTSRQKFQRAFAQEFLCPSSALLQRFGSLPPEDEDIETAAQHFEVSPLLVRSKLAYLNIVPRF
jgi:Zn-dependent peptidase ImmA (M78 family)